MTPLKVRLTRLIKVFFVFMFLLLISDGNISAACNALTDPELICGFMPPSTCTTEASGTASRGWVRYAPASNYIVCQAFSGGNGYYQHEFRCDDQPCGGPGVPGGGGGGFVCPMARVDCPLGSVRGTTLQGSQCESYQCQSNVGSAQQTGSCCNWNTPPRECSDWYCGNDRGPRGNTCGFRANGEERCCRDCTQEPPWCVQYNYETYNCVSTCSATAPTNLTITPLSLTSSRANWTPGTGGVSQSIYIGSNKTDVEANCASGSCAVAVTTLGATQSNYTTGSVLSPGTTYYYRVVNVGGAACSANSSTATSLLSCSLNPTALSLSPGQNSNITASVNASPDILRVDFASSSPSASVSPASDATYPYSTTVTANSTGNATITATVYYTGGTVACQTGSASFPGSQSTSVTVLNTPAWWQVKDSDVSTNGNLVSLVPSANYFGLPGTGGFAGVPAYGGTTNLTSGNFSQSGWSAQSSMTVAKVYDYNFFANQMPADTSVYLLPNNVLSQATINANTTQSYGYYWYRFDGTSTGLDLNINSAIDIGARKVILLVDSADLYINAPINLTDGQGFFMAVVGKNSGGTEGDIVVNPSVGGGAFDLEGLYVADGSFSTGVGANQLRVRGSVVGYGGINLQRDLANNSLPAEFFEYAPDQILLFPSKFGLRRLNWKEVAP